MVDKPVGVAAHPSPGWTGPTVIGGLAGAGYRISTSGAAERQGIVHRLDVGTSGLMVVAKSERAYTALKRAFKERTVEKIYHALVQGHPDPITRHRRRADRPAPDPRLAVGRGRQRQAERHPLRDPRGASGPASLLEIHLETGRTHQIRVHMAALRHPCVGDLTYGADPALAARLGLSGSGCTPAGSASTTPTTGEWVSVTSDYPADLDARPRRHPRPSPEDAAS